MNIHKSFVVLSMTVLSQSFLCAEQISNDWLEDGSASWTTKSAPGASVSASVITEDGQNVLQVVVADVASESGASGDVRVYRSFGGVEADQSYTIRFQAKAEEPGKAIVFIHPQDAPQQVLLRKDITVNQDWSDFTIKFTVKNASSLCVLGFAGIGKSNNTFTFREIVLEH
ncbi:carbohydrate binding domain-containing protein [Terrimicrobium sacchariphilum]|uniref:Carbohydrate binding domain-containing protein n=1 Tax=Terrimicrobium sacchariphilum TaxID=690879 RepID=A0A146G524_TERSA|nr:carbohydrate binding domain-containing protein [Terrimicrobium sacchariphilum]GAT31876.1 carbohydrate binding domain-containing protein [Terrimicrobium sacchariphilum]